MTVTLITGASRGIGAYLVEHYRAVGHDVIAWNRKEYADITDDLSLRAAFPKVVDNLINCAGIASMNHALLTPMDKVSQVLQTNVAGTFLMCREAARLMKKQGLGRIVNFSSVAVPLALEGEAIYAASKAAVETLTKVLAKEFGPWHITVNAVGPNPIKTDLIKNVSNDKIDAILERQSIKWHGVMDDVANVVDFFLRPESRMITGQVIYLGGVG